MPGTPGPTPPTAGLAAVPGGGTTHSPVGDVALRRVHGHGHAVLGRRRDEPGRATVRPTTTPGPPVASMVVGVRLIGGDTRLRARGDDPCRPRQHLVRQRGQGPGRQPEPHRDRLRGRPGLNTSISESPPGHLLRLGMAQCGLRRRRHPARATGRPRSHPPRRSPAPPTRRRGRSGRVDDGADGVDLLDLRRHVLDRHLSRRQHDPLVVDRVDHARRRHEAQIDHDRRRRRIQQRDGERVGRGGGAAGEIPLGRGGALAGRL